MKRILIAPFFSAHKKDVIFIALDVVAVLSVVAGFTMTALGKDTLLTDGFLLMGFSIFTAAFIYKLRQEKHPELS